MFSFPSKYRKIVTVALVLLLMVPCAVKRDLKQWLQIETNQSAKPVQYAVACSVFQQQQQQHKKEKTEKHLLPAPVADAETASFALPKKIQLPDYYTGQKEKIPSYILFDRFLI